MRSHSRKRSRTAVLLPGLLPILAFASLTAFGQELNVPDFKSNKPTPRTGDGHPDLSGYWKGTRETKPVGNIAKDLPDHKLPFTPAGEAAWKHNVTATIDPESLCIIGGIPSPRCKRACRSKCCKSKNKVTFLYWYTYYRLIPIDANRKHTEDPDPTFFGEELGHWDKDALVIDSIGFKDEKVWIDENADPHSDDMHVVERWNTRSRTADHIHVDATDRRSKKFFTRPFNYQRTWVLGKAEEEVHEYSCSENNVDRDHLGFGPGPIRADGSRGYEELKPLPPPLRGGKK